MYFVRGASFDKKEFKRIVAGSGAYAPLFTVQSFEKPYVVTLNSSKNMIL
jgi:hypothetical protein